MIDQVTGQIAKLDKDSVVVLVGGVGLRIRTPRTALTGGIGQPITLFTHLIVREDDLSLYGFATEEERTVFETLITVSGVGPRTGLAILSTLSIDHLRNAVAGEQPEILTRVPGIGKKTAEKIIFELRGKMRAETGLIAINDTDADVLAALTALGYSIVEAQSAIQSIPRDAPQDIESRVMLALQYFT